MQLSQIWLYPIKSCRGIQLVEAELDERGLKYDRHWMVVTSAGQMVTLRDMPQLAQVTPQLLLNYLHVDAPGMPSLKLPFHSEGEKMQVRLWEGWAEATVLPECTTWFQSYLKRDVYLVRVASTTSRIASLEQSQQLSFVDSSPLNLVGEASLADLNARLEEPVAIEQFRPNLVFTGAAPYAEDSWQRLKIGAIKFHAYEACERCMVVNISVDGSYAKEPLATLASYRRSGRNVLFGVGISHLQPGTLRVGDTIIVEEKGLEVT